jgi:RNA polymerase sigma-70 factor (ECF subfamily)
MTKKPNYLYEKILLEKVRENDQSSFSVIFTGYYSDMVQFAGTFINDLDTCEDIVQNAFVDFWENRETLIILSSLKSYLLKMIQNRCIDWLRHMKIREQYNNYADHHLRLMENDTENYILRSELEVNLEKALKLLPSEISFAFRLNRQEGLTYKEIAERENVSVRTIEMRISKALVLLREHLKDYLITILVLCDWLIR